MQKSDLIKLLVLILLFLLLSACQAGEVKPLATLTPKDPTQTSSPTAEPTEIIIPSASNTPSPTQTLNPTSYLPTATPDWVAFDLDAWMSASPDGEWVAKIIVAYPPTDASGEYAVDAYHSEVSVQSSGDMSLGWTVVDEWLSIGLGMTTPTVLRWTQDGQSLFIADTGVPDGCGPAFYLNVRKVDLQNGQLTSLDEDLFGKLSLSPDGSSLVSFSIDTGLIVHDLNGGGRREIAFAQPEGVWWPGEVVWSPDGREFLFDLRSDPCSVQEGITSSIWRASLESEGATALIVDNPNSLSLQSWPKSCLAQVNDTQGGVFWLNPCSGDLNQTASTEVAQALDVLQGFFDALQQGNYTDAVGYYGGSYETLWNNNESIDPDNYAALWSNACQVNGFVCLPVGGYVLESWTEQNELRFSVTFERDGEIFVLGPCCGASIIDQPPVSRFTFTLVKDSTGSYRVQELPVYVP